jgi:5-methylthioadenosine/S-adenosylhomocysteine deaminase
LAENTSVRKIEDRTRANLAFVIDTTGPRVDLLVVGHDVITMNARREIVRDGAVAIAGDTIVEVSKARDLRARWPDAAVLGDATTILTPGFVNAHQHLTGDRLIRSAIPDDLGPGESIFGWAVPIHAAHSAEDDEFSAILSCLEQVTNGVTTIIEAGTVAHPMSVAAAMRAIGVRGTVGTWGWDVETGPFAAPADEVLDRQRAVVDALAGDALLGGAVTLVGHSLMSDELLAGASALARERGVILTFHISPDASDAAAWLERAHRRPLVHFDALGALGPHVLLAHAVHLDDAECDIVLSTDTAIAYTPWAYLRLGQGVSAHGRHARLARAGARIGLGCDAENASDALDPLRVCALAAGIGKDQTMDPTAFGAHDALELATIGGARAVGLADKIGSIEAGKQADLVVHDTRGPQWVTRAEDPVVQLVWASDGRGVRDVVVAGRVVVRAGQATGADLDALRGPAEARKAALLERAGITARSRWPVV